jgi:hypothetical protein
MESHGVFHGVKYTAGADLQSVPLLGSNPCLVFYPVAIRAIIICLARITDPR